MQEDYKTLYKVKFSYHNISMGESYETCTEFDTLEEAQALVKDIKEHLTEETLGDKDWWWENYQWDGYPDEFLGLFEVKEKEIEGAD